MEGVFFISFYETMLLQQKQLQQKLTDIQKQLQQLPEGKLICTRCGNRTKWYRSDGHTKTYIPKDQKPYASQLAIRTSNKQKGAKESMKYPDISKAVEQEILASYDKLYRLAFSYVKNEQDAMDVRMPGKVSDYLLKLQIKVQKCQSDQREKIYQNMAVAYCD